MSYNNKLKPVILNQAWHSLPAHARMLSGVYRDRRGFTKQNIHIKKGDLFCLQWGTF